MKEENVKQWHSVDEVLDFAIQAEEEAVQFYTELALKMENQAMRKLFEEFALEEKGHKVKLQGIKESGQLQAASKKVMDLKIGDYLVDVDPNKELDYRNALILAMKREKASFRLYTNLSAATEDSDWKDLLLALAQEEAKHKLRFEVEYDDYILKEN